MSIVPLIQNPIVIQAAELLMDSASARRQPAYGRQNLLVPSIRGSQAGLVGTSFDYFARTHLAREFCATKAQFRERNWIAELEASRLPIHSEVGRRCRDNIEMARSALTSYSSGRGNPYDVAEHCQRLANIDLLYRAPEYFRAMFNPISTVTEQIVRLAEVLDRNIHLFSGQTYAMNPSFPRAKPLCGADADIIIDHRLLDWKTTKNHSISRKDLLQVAIYAALQQLGGYECGGFKSREPFCTVELYFARYGELVVWETDKLFPAAAFKKFVRTIELAMDQLKRPLNPRPSSTPQ